MKQVSDRLEDSQFRATPGFPVGTIDDIVALSDPPLYTACRNPFANEFVRTYGKPYLSSEPYRREPLAVDVSEGKNDAVYNAHAYHTKVSYLAVRKYIEHFTEPNDLVLDFFAGTGMTGVAALQCAGGPRHSILCDLSPVATHVAAGFTSPVLLSSARSKAKALIEKLEADHAWMYATAHTGWPSAERRLSKRHNSQSAVSPQPGRINFVVWSDVFVCPQCANEITFWDAAVSFTAEGVLEEFKCPSCDSDVTKRGMSKAMSSDFDDKLNQVVTSIKQTPVLINYTHGNRRYEKRPDDKDLEVLRRVKATQLPAWVPSERMPDGDESRRNDDSGITHIHHFYTRRNLIALSALREAIGDNRILLFWFTATLPWCGRDNRLHISNYFGRKGGQITSLRGTWYIPSLSVETNVFERARLRISSALVSVPKSSGRALVTTQSATDLSNLPEDSIDYIFVDPPFGSNLMYSELNAIWEAWLRVSTSSKDEAIVNKTQKKGLMEYQLLMEESFAQGYRVLKPGRWMTVEFHNSQNSVWNSIQEALQKAGFIVADVRTLDKGKGSFKQVTSAGTVKQDLVISAYKPNGGLVRRFQLEAGSAEGAWDFVRTHLKQLPVFVSKDGASEIIAERQNYLLFDRMVAFHVERGVSIPLSAGDFYEGLSQRFAEREGMFFLPEQVSEYDQKRLKAKEVHQLEIFVRNETTAIQWLRQQLRDKPQKFQELHPKFIREIAGWEKHEKSLELKDLLEENFLCYDGEGEVPGQIHSHLSTNFHELRNLRKNAPALQQKAKDRYYIPDPNKEADVQKTRDRALLNEFDQYRDSAQRALKVFRLEAVRAGFRRAWQQNDYATILAVAGKIPEDILQQDPMLLMWYTNSLTRAGRQP